MAVAIPILMSATGLTASIATALSISTTMVTIGTGIAMAATGIGASINKAASKVFGEDLVNAANLVGGIAMASGWNPADGFSMGASAGAGGMGGSVDTAGLDASIAAAGGGEAGLNAVAAANGGIDAAAASSGPAGFDALRAAERGGYQSGAGYADVAAERAVGTAGAGVKAGGVLSNAADKAMKWYDGQPERVKAALVTGAGQAVAGAAGGYMRAKEAEKEIEERRRREERFQTGSGTTFTYKPGVLARAGG